MSSILIIGGDDPLGAQLASRLKRLHHDVAVTIHSQTDAELTHAFSHRGIEVFLCDPYDPLSLSTAIAGREEVYLCLKPEPSLPKPYEIPTLTPLGWRGLGANLGALLQSLRRSQQLKPDPFRSHEQQRILQASTRKSPLTIALEACSFSSSIVPQITLLCSMFALDPQAFPLDQKGLIHHLKLYQPSLTPPHHAVHNFFQRLKQLYLPQKTPITPTWSTAHQSIEEAILISLPIVFYGLPYHEQRLLSSYSQLDLLSWLHPTCMSCVALEDLATGLIQLRAYIEKGKPSSGIWYLGGDNLRVDLIEEALGVEFTPAQQQGLKAQGKLNSSHSKMTRPLHWTLTSSRAQLAFNYEWQFRRCNTGERLIHP